MGTTDRARSGQVPSAFVIGAASLLALGSASCTSSSGHRAVAVGATPTSAAPAVVDPTASDTSAATPSSASTGATTAGKSGHPCGLLTQAEVASAVGTPTGPGVEEGSLGAGGCFFNQSSGAYAGATLSIAGWNQISAPYKVTGPGSSPLSGIGDEAYSISATSETAPVLLVRKGSNGFTVAIHGAHVDSLPDHGLAVEKSLAALISSRS